MARYVDGFVLVVPKKNLSMYRKMAREGKKIWMKHGALDYKECKGDDLRVKPMGDIPAPLSFIKLAKAKPSETVWFSFIVYRSKKHRNQVNAKVMKQMKKEEEKWKNMPMPFDMKKMAYGGFTVEVDK
jgi:alkaline phosphatase